MRAALALALALGPILLAAGCGVERVLDPSSFACEVGGPCVDAGPRRDAGPDAEVDAGAPRDTGPTDATRLDAEPVDAASPDAEPGDAGPVDGGPEDATPDDAAGLDGAVDDLGVDAEADGGGAGPDAAADAGADTGAADLGVDAGGLPVCTNDGDCIGADRLCWSGRCELRCDRTGGLDCGVLGGQCAASGRCEGALALGDRCVLDEDCGSELCLSVVRNGNTSTFCATGCSAASSCPLGFGCDRVSGMPLCLPASFSGNAASTPAGGFCDRATNTCQSGWCNTGVRSCIESCSAPDDCAVFGGNCTLFVQTSSPSLVWENLCARVGTATRTVGAACAVDGDCTSGICDRDSRRCAQHCCTDLDCGARESCRVYAFGPEAPVKICRGRVSPGTTPLGAPCASPIECASGLCIPVDPEQPQGARVCTSHCCEDADCAGVLSGGGRCRPQPVLELPGTIAGQCSPG